MRVQNWMIEIGVVVLMVGAVAGLSGCKEENRDRNVGTADYELQAEGCTVKHIDNPKGYNFFIAKCPAESETISWQKPSGKTSYTTATVVTKEAQKLRDQLEIAEAKEKALNKLSDVEKRLLGIKE